MNGLKKILGVLTKQINKSNVTMPISEIPHKITDDNQSIHNGVTNEKHLISLRSKASNSRKRG